MPLLRSFDAEVRMQEEGFQMTEYMDENFDDTNRDNDDSAQPVIVSMGRADILIDNTIDIDEASDGGTDREIPRLVRTSCYIEAVTDATFEIKISLGPRFPFSRMTSFPFKTLAVRICVEVDGKYGDSGIINFKYMKRSQAHVEKVLAGPRKSREGDMYQHKFRFAKLVIVEGGPRGACDPEIGKVRVKMWRVISERGGQSNRNLYDERLRSADDGPISEACLKKGGAVDHGTGFVEESKVGKARAFPKVTYIDGRDHPFANCEFKIRSRKALKDLGVIAFSPPSDSSGFLAHNNDNHHQSNNSNTNVQNGSSSAPIVVKDEQEENHNDRSLFINDNNDNNVIDLTNGSSNVQAVNNGANPDIVYLGTSSVSRHRMPPADQIIEID